MALLWQGVKLMLLGMGTVFLFLALLVIVMSTILRLLERILERDASTDLDRSAFGMQPAVGPEMIAVLTAAVRRYRSMHRKSF